MDPNKNKNGNNRPDYGNAFNIGYQNQLAQQQELYQQQFQQLESLQHHQQFSGSSNQFPPILNYPYHPLVPQMIPLMTPPVNNPNIFQQPPLIMNQQQVQFHPESNLLQLNLLQQEIEFKNTEYIRTFTKQARLSDQTGKEIYDSSFEQTMIEEPTMEQIEPREESNINEEYYTIDEIKQILQCDDSKSMDLRFQYYIELADHFINKAHLLVGKTINNEIMEMYFKMIKISIKCLKILDRMNLNLYQKFIIYYKLSIIYLKETENLEICENYLNKAISIAQNLNDLSKLFNCELLIIQIIEKTNFKSLINYLNSKLQFYKDRNLNVLVDCLELIKIRYNMIHNPDNALNSLSLLTENSSNVQIKTYCLIQSANLHLYRSSPEIGLRLAEQANELIQENNIESLILPLLLTKFVAYIQLNKDCKKIIGQASKFMTRDDKSTLGLKDGKILLSVFVPELNHNFEFNFDWLTTEEFSVIAHLLTGVSLLNDSRNKSKICFEKALKNISKIEKTNKFTNITIEKLHEKLQRLKYLKFLINYYQTINNFIMNNYQVDPLNKFMRMTEKEITDKEYVMYKGFYPMIYYCFAMFYHHNADIQAAKYYYLKVIELQSVRSHSNVQHSFIQLLHGIPCESIAPKGKFNELYIFSTFNLVILLNYECNKLRDQIPDYTIELRNKCMNDLEEAFKNNLIINNSFNYNFTLNSDILNVTYNLILKILLHKETNLELKTKMGEMLLSSDMKSSSSSSSSFFSILMMYLLEFKIPGDEGDKLLGYYRDKLKSDNDTEDICRLLILKVFIKHFKMIGDYDKASLSQMQYDQCKKKLSTKFEFLNNNLVPKTNKKLNIPK